MIFSLFYRIAMPFHPGTPFAVFLLILCLGVNIVSYPEVHDMLRRDGPDATRPDRPEKSAEFGLASPQPSNRPIRDDEWPECARPAPATPAMEPLVPFPAIEPLSGTHTEGKTELPSVFQERTASPAPEVPATQNVEPWQREQPMPPYAAPFRPPLPARPASTARTPPKPSPIPIWDTVETALERPVMMESPAEAR